MVGRKNLLTALPVVALFWAIAAITVMTSVSYAEEEVELFKSSNDVMADVDATLAKAKANNKLALFVMGANWCHDSQGLLDHFAKPEMMTLLAEHYETQLVDVGLLDAGAAVNRRFGLPVIYGTPTVLIVEPHTERLLNEKDLQQWYNAASIGLEDTVSYFSAKAQPTVRHAANELITSDTLKALYDEIDAFEEEQAKRIYRGFAVVGPMVGMDRSERPRNFYRLWEQLRVLRYKIPDDIVTLKAMARRRVARGETDIKLEYPTYPPLEWENQ